MLINIDLLSNPQHTIQAEDFISLHSFIIKYLSEPLLSKAEIDMIQIIKEPERPPAVIESSAA